MEKNPVVEILENIVDTDKIDFIGGDILGVGTDECRLSDERGSVYGIAIQIKDKNDKETVFNAVSKSRRKLENADQWKEITNDFYPLYWGKDVNMGSRLFSHTKTMKSTGTLQLNTISSVLGEHRIIYGAVPCLNRLTNEDKLHERYADLLKTVKGSDDSLKTTDLLES